MSRVFMPLIFEDVPASEPHKSGLYRVSYGLEEWDEEKVFVLKVQMVKDGQVLGRKAPSYPLDSDDFERVAEAMKRVRKGIGKKARGQMTSVGPERGLPLDEAKRQLG